MTPLRVVFVKPLLILGSSRLTYSGSMKMHEHGVRIEGGTTWMLIPWHMICSVTVEQVAQPAFDATATRYPPRITSQALDEACRDGLTIPPQKKKKTAKKKARKRVRSKGA